MNWNGLVTVALALCCLFAVGTVSTTLESSVSTQPDEVIRFDNDALPAGSDAVEDIREAVNRAEGGSAASTGRDGEQTRETVERETESSQASSSSAQSQSSQTTEPPSLLDRLLALLEALLALLVRAAPLVALVAALAALVYFRDRLFDNGSERHRSGPSAESAVGEPAPSNDVTNAWFEMVRRFSDADRHAWTPREHAETAAEVSDDPDAASALTSLFEEVRYGGESVTPDRRERARSYLERLSPRTDGGTEAEDDR